VIGTEVIEAFERLRAEATSNRGFTREELDDAIGAAAFVLEALPETLNGLTARLAPEGTAAAQVGMPEAADAIAKLSDLLKVAALAVTGTHDPGQLQTYREAARLV
jgi:hypothetical protein